MLTPILYPGATWHYIPNHAAPGTLQQRNLVVVHVTDGLTAAGAINTFASSEAPNRVSSHFVIDRDGSITQLIDIRDTAWHASQVNSHSIGIEHVALTTAGAKALNRKHGTTEYALMPATDAQYAASAKLVAWCCQQMGVPVDRSHVMGHFQASPADHHLCPADALDVDRLVSLAASASQEIPSL